jgi:uncharacterized protein YqkB
MNVYAIENDRSRLLLVRRERYGGIDYRLVVVNGGYEVKMNKDKSISPTYTGDWKAYFVMQAPKMSGDYNDILNEVDKLLDHSMTGG